MSGPPDFVGVGVQRGGTSWWWRLLSAHPGVHTPSGDLRRVKERHFFTGPPGDGDAGRCVDEYAQQFPRPSGQLAGEWTPRYMYDPWTPRLLAAAAPSARLLVMLRDPVERCRSALGLMARQQGAEAPTKRARYHDAVHRGLYAGQLRLLLEHFDRRRVLVLQYERCLADPRSELERTYRFLGLEPGGFAPPALARARRGRVDKPALSHAARRDLVARYAPDVAQLVAAHPEIDLSLWPNFAGH